MKSEEYTEQELAERNKRWKDHDAYELICKFLWVPDHKRCAVFGAPDFYEHAKKLIETEEYQYRIQQALALAKFVNDLKGRPETIIEILNRKKQGIDCTENESAEIKGFLREIVKEFPLEYGEILEEG